MIFMIKLTEEQERIQQANFQKNMSRVEMGMKPEEYEIPMEYHYTMYDPKYYELINDIEKEEYVQPEKEEEL